MMMPQIPLDYRTDRDKVASLIWTIRLNFYLPLVRFKRTIVIERTCPRYEKNGEGTLSEVHDEIAISAERLRLIFECKGEVGRFRLEDLSEDAFTALLSAAEYPQKFNVYALTPKGKVKFASLSDIT